MCGTLPWRGPAPVGSSPAPPSGVPVLSLRRFPVPGVAWLGRLFLPPAESVFEGTFRRVGAGVLGAPCGRHRAGRWESGLPCICWARVPRVSRRFGASGALTIPLGPVLSVPCPQRPGPGQADSRCLARGGTPAALGPNRHVDPPVASERCRATVGPADGHAAFPDSACRMRRSLCVFLNWGPRYTGLPRRAESQSTLAASCTPNAFP